MTGSYGLCFAFTDSSPNFVHGYEAGVLGALMHMQRERIENPVPYHVDNLQLFERMSDFYGYTMTSTPSAVEGWVDVVFDLKPPQPAKASHLRLVKS